MSDTSVIDPAESLSLPWRADAGDQRMWSDEELKRARFLETEEGRIALKWHRGRLASSAASFDPEVIARGLGLGAWIEVDLRPLSGGGFAVLHDKTLARETTGRGRVSALTIEDLRALFMRGPDGERLPRHPMEFADLVHLISRSTSGNARIHLDLKAERDELTPAHISHFRHLASPIRHRLEVGGRDWQAVMALTEELGDIRRGFDPTVAILSRPGLDPKGFEDLMTGLLDKTKGADVYYIHYATITAWKGLGLNPVEMVKDAGASAEAWTIDMQLEDLRYLVTDLAQAGVDCLITDDAPGLAEFWANSEQDSCASDNAG